MQWVYSGILEESFYDWEDSKVQKFAVFYGWTQYETLLIEDQIILKVWQMSPFSNLLPFLDLIEG